MPLTPGKCGFKIFGPAYLAASRLLISRGGPPWPPLNRRDSLFTRSDA